jgi:hypothetical protein
MRRAITSAVVGVLVFGAAAATPAFAAGRANQQYGTGNARPAAHVIAKANDFRSNKSQANQKETGKATTDTLRTITYAGYQFRVPATWPVYRLDQHPAACVRYDINAVYLGTPGTSMTCPAVTLGRAQTVSVIPSTTVAAGAGAEVTYQRQQPDSLGGSPLRSLPAVRATVIANPGAHELRVALGAAALGATVLGTYGADPAVVEQVLATLHVAPKDAVPTSQTGSLAALSAPTPSREPDAAQSAVSAIVAARSRATGLPLAFGRPRGFRATATGRQDAAAPASTSWPGIPPDWPIQIVPPPPSPQPSWQPLAAFDTCTAPPLTAMRAWYPAYAAVGVYIGGANYGCSYGNLSASWISAVAGMGWKTIPTYVGPQAPCWGYSGAKIDPRLAATQGRQDGADAVRDASTFGLTAGSPIYYDMEAYVGDASCRTAVLNFLGAWDREVTALGYVSGVYSSADSGIADMQAATLAKTPGFTPPDAVWVAQWDGVASLSAAGLGSLTWPLADRNKQYEGNLWKTVGGVTLNIDQDLAGGPLGQ